MTGNEKFRIFHATDREITHAITEGLVEAIIKIIPESKIQNLCEGCDNLDAEGMCRIVNNNDQSRYAERDWCGYARVNGVSKIKTSEGFTKGILEK